MIEPTVGRVVWYRPGAHELNLSLSDQPLAAIITYVNDDDTINLAVFGKGGDCHQRASVPLWQGDGDAPERRTYAEWPVIEAKGEGLAPVYDGSDGEANFPQAGTERKPTYSTTPVKPSTEPVQPLPSAPIDPDPYASSVDSVGDLDSPANPDRPLD